MSQLSPSRRSQLLAVASVAILALALGGVNRAWVQPNRQTYSCVSNLEQISRAMAMYRQDHDERFPRAANWMDAASPYLTTKEVFQCPARRDLEFGYAMNPRLSGIHTARLENPAEIAVVFDSDVNRQNAVDWNTAVTPPFRHSGRRYAGITITYADGHTRAAKTYANFTKGILPPKVNKKK